MPETKEHVVSLTGGCVSGVWTVVVRCECGWWVQPPRPADVERSVRGHMREVQAA